jgi:hypothetical protein
VIQFLITADYGRPLADSLMVLDELESVLKQIDAELATIPGIQEKRRSVWALCFQIRRVLGIPGLPPLPTLQKPLANPTK